MKTKDQALEQVKKLLVLANDRRATDDEATQAALMAQKLMVKYDIDMTEAEQETASEIVSVSITHKENAKFRVSLSKIISGAFRCKVFQLNNQLYFIGFTEDAKIAKSVFEFVYSFMLRRIKNLECSAWRKTGSTTGVRNSYAQGFLEGLKTAIDAQSRELMVIVPQEVTDEFEARTAGWGKKTVSLSTSRFHSEYFETGKKDGAMVMGQRQIEEA